MANAPHIFTFTGNSLAETCMDFGEWSPGRTQRASSASFQMGGKGINVTKMLLRLGAPGTALCFLGGHSGNQCLEWLEDRSIPHIAFATQSPTRSGLVVRSPGREETTFLGPDSPPDATAWQAAAERISEIRRSATKSPTAPVLAFCGSIPGWASTPAAPFRTAIEDWLNARLPLFVDTYGPPLAWFVNHPVELVKINLQEFRSLLGTEQFCSIEDALGSALVRWPAKAWVITDGPAAVWFGEKGGKPISILPPVIKEVSATGSGDVLQASLLFALLHKGLSLRESLAFALPLAAANAAAPGIAEFPLPPALC